MMKKIISVIFMVAVLICNVMAEYIPDPYLDSLANKEASDNFRGMYDKIIINIMPFSGANNVNMRSTNYPQRDNAGANLEFNDQIAFESIDINNNNNIYRDEHMVAMGGLEGVPTDRITLSTKDYNGVFGDDKPHISVILGKNGEVAFSPVEITVQSSTDFMYVSQERNIYQRPYELYVSRRKAISKYDNMVPGGHSSDSFVKLGGIENIRNAELILPSGGDDLYANAWFDLILALPYESYTNNGVYYKNSEYPLRDSADYTSSIEIQLKWIQPYEIYENMQERYPSFTTGEKWEWRCSGEIIKETSISIPFAGYSSTIDPEYKETTASLIIMPTAAASQLSLNNGDTGPGHGEEVAEIQFMMNFPEYTTSEPENENVWMFLSASPTPYSSNNNGFVLVHKNAGNVLTSYNSANYKVYVTDKKGNQVAFDGKAKAADFNPIAGGDGYIVTNCNRGIYLPHEAKSEADTILGIPTGDYTYLGDTFHHYHEYQGTVSVEIEDTALKPDGMLAGRYTSEIYIHVMTSD
ncbi:MAG: hypothetical protein H9802_08560 [Candidatus Phocaeicola faecipullorum]|nr:hypothetical protein [Candidatus Phocaeicola faecipullorum]